MECTPVHQHKTTRTSTKTATCARTGWRQEWWSATACGCQMRQSYCGIQSSSCDINPTGTHNKGSEREKRTEMKLARMTR